MSCSLPLLLRLAVHPPTALGHSPVPMARRHRADAAESTEGGLPERSEQASGGTVCQVRCQASAALGRTAESLVSQTLQAWLDEQFATPPPHRILVSAGWRRCRDSLPFWDVYGSRGEPMQTVRPFHITHSLTRPTLAGVVSDHGC